MLIKNSPIIIISVFLIATSLLFFDQEVIDNLEPNLLKQDRSYHNLSMPETIPVVQASTPHEKKFQQLPLNPISINPPQTISGSESEYLHKPTISDESIISVKESQVSIHVQNQPLHTILHEISHKANITIFGSEHVANQMISINFQDVLITKVLEYLLNQQDTFFFFEAQTQSSSKLRSVWVYPKGKGIQFAPVPTMANEIELGLNDPDPEQRSQAIESLIEKKSGDALDEVLLALQDTDDQVRYRTLFKALFSGISLPSTLLMNLAQMDTSASVREVALTAMLDRPDIDRQTLKGIAEYAVNDLDIGLRSKAMEVLSHLATVEHDIETGLPSQEVP